MKSVESTNTYCQLGPGHSRQGAAEVQRAGYPNKVEQYKFTPIPIIISSIMLVFSLVKHVVKINIGLIVLLLLLITDYSTNSVRQFASSRKNKFLRTTQAWKGKIYNDQRE
jgi:hypothetical protein